MAYYSSIDDIREKFEELNAEQWQLYNGKAKNRPKPEVKYRFLLDEYTGNGSEESFSHLENVLNRVSLKGGNATLFIGRDDQTPVLIMPISLSSKTTTRQVAGQVAGQAGAMPGIRGFNDTLSDKLAIYDLQRKLADMENASQGSFLERIGERVLDNISPDLLVAGITAIISKVAGVPVQMPAAVQGAPTAGAQTDFTPGLDESIDRLVDALSGSFEDEREMIQFIDKMTNTVKNNPAILKQLR